MFDILLFNINFFFAIACGAVVICVAIFIPLYLFIIPYSFWLANQQQCGRHKDKVKNGFFIIVKNAFKLYKSWLTHKEPNF